MPFDRVMHKFKRGTLHSGSKKGPAVKDRDQAIAIMLSEKQKAGKKEYQPKKKSKSAGALKGLKAVKFGG